MRITRRSVGYSPWTCERTARMSDRVPVTIQVPAALRELTGGRAEIEIAARTVEEVLEQLRHDEPMLAGRLFADDGFVRGYINVFVDGTELRHLEEGRREINPGTVFTIVPSVAGG